MEQVWKIKWQRKREIITLHCYIKVGRYLMIMSSAIQIFSPELHSVQDFGKMKKIKLFSNFTAHSGVITLKDGWGFSFQLEHFLFYNKYTVKVNKSIFKLCYEGCYEASRHRYPRRLGLNNLFLVFCRKISRILEMKTKGFCSFQN